MTGELRLFHSCLLLSVRSIVLLEQLDHTGPGELVVIEISIKFCFTRLFNPAATPVDLPPLTHSKTMQCYSLSRFNIF